MNNINIISIFSVGKKAEDDDWNIQLALKEFKQLFDSDGLTPFCHTFKQNNVPLMKTLMDTFKDKVDEENPDYSIFSKFMLCFVTTNDAQWAIENLD